MSGSVGLRLAALCGVLVAARFLSAVGDLFTSVASCTLLAIAFLFFFPILAFTLFAFSPRLFPARLADSRILPAGALRLVGIAKKLLREVVCNLVPELVANRRSILALGE